MQQFGMNLVFGMQVLGVMGLGRTGPLPKAVELFMLAARWVQYPLNNPD